MFPEPEDPVKEVFLLGVLFWVIAFILFVSLSGCAPVAIAPNLKIPEPAKECPRLVMPPIPEHVFLKIEGDKVFSDDGGDTMLRGYVRARQLLE
jgi:hypothetical protein